MVTVAIIAVLSGGAIAGWGKLNGSLTPFRAGELIKDIVDRVEQEISLRKKYKEVTLYFFKDYPYLVTVAKPSEYSLNLEWDKTACNGSGGPVTVSNGLLYIKSSKGIKTISSKVEEACYNFTEAEENEWSYQLISETDVSPVIRLTHFNLDRDESLARVTGNDSKLVITSPYAKKRFYDGIVPEPNVDGQLVFTLGNDSNTTDITLY